MIRICILTANNEPAAFMDNDAPDALHYYNDTLHTYLAGCAYTFEFTADATHPDVSFLAVGNKLAFVDEYENKYYCNIMQTEQDEQIINVVAMGLSFELINENAPAYEASSAMTFAQYMTAMGYDSNVIQIGINEVSTSSRTNTWESNTETRLARLFSLASLFHAELEFVPQLNRDYSLDKIILNIYKEHDTVNQGMGRIRDDVRLRYGIDIAGITRKADLSNLYTQIYPTGKDGLTISSKAETIYDENGNVEYQTTLGETAIRAVQARSQFPSNTSVTADKYISYYWSTDYETVNDLYGNALAKLKEICKPAVEYEITGYADLNIGDTVTITDDAFTPALYLEVRVTEQERSFTEPERNTTKFDNVTELTSQISGDLAAQIEELQAQVSAAQATASSAASDASDALTAAGNAQADATQALSDASAASSAAGAAQADATQALSDAAAAQGDATQALSDAAAAQGDATQALSDASAAQGDATQALADASAAQGDATQALSDASAAQTTANAASQAVAAVSNYFFHDNDGAHVTSAAGDATTGNNVLIDANSFDIRDGTSVLASFAANLVELGKNGNTSVIDFINGLGQIKAISQVLETVTWTVMEIVSTTFLKLVTQDSGVDQAYLQLYRNKIDMNAGGIDLYASGANGGLNLESSYGDIDIESLRAGIKLYAGLQNVANEDGIDARGAFLTFNGNHVLTNALLGGSGKTLKIGHESLQYASGTLLSRDVTTGLSSVDYAFATMAGTAAGSSYPVAASNGPPSLYVRKNASSAGHIIICAYGTGFVSGHVFPVDYIAIGDP